MQTNRPSSKLTRPYVAVLAGCIAVLSVIAVYFGPAKKVLPDRSLSLSLTVGDQRVYGLHYVSSGEANMQAALNSALPGSTSSAKANAAGAESLEMAIDGALVITVAAEKAGVYELVAAVQTEKSKFSVGGKSQDDVLAPLSGSLWRLQVDHQGHLRGLDLPEDMGAIGRNIVRTLLGFMRTSLPAGKTDQWQAEELGLYGALLADYTLDARSADKTVMISKSLRPKGGLVGGGPGDLQLSGTVTYALDGSTLALADLDGTLTAVQSVKGQIVSHTDNRLSLKLQQSLRPSPAALATLQRTLGSVSPADLQGQDEFERLRRERYEQIVAASPLTMTLNAADAQTQAGKLARVPGSLIEQLKAHLALTPGAVAMVEERLRSARTRSVPFNLYISVLAFNSSPEAQLVLQRLITDRRSEWTAASTALAALAMVPRPSSATVGYLSQLAADEQSDLGHASLLALSSVGRTLSPQDPVAADAIYQNVVGRLDTATNTAARYLAITALGNLGNEAQLDKLRPLLAVDQTVAMRELAVHAMRFIGGTRTKAATTTMIDVLTTDPEPVVRASAAGALEMHGPDPESTAAVQAQLKLETSPIVVAQLLKNLSVAAVQNRSARSTLERYAKTCGANDVCVMAQHLVLAMAGS